MRYELTGVGAIEVDVAPDAPLEVLGAVVEGAGHLLVEGAPVDPGLPVGSVWEGSVLGRSEARAEQSPVAELIGRSGVDAGGRWRLAPGGYDLTSRGGPVVWVDAGGAVTVRSADRAGSITSVPAGERCEAGGTTWEVGVPSSQATRPAPVAGRRSFNRPPRRLTDRPGQPIEVPFPPEEPTGRTRPGLAMVAGPVLMGTIMAFVFRPIMAVIALVGPLLVGLSWAEDRWRMHRTRRRNGSTWAAALHSFEDELSRAAHREIALRRERHPDMPEVLECATEHGSSLWERRPHHPDYLRVCLGIGRAGWEPPVRADPGAEQHPDVASRISEYSLLPDAPVEVNLLPGTMVGIAGDRPGGLALVRGLLVRLAAHHGPADLRLAIITDASVVWEWCSWLPHTRVDALSGRHRLAVEPDEVESVVASLAGGGPDLLVVVDAAGLDPRTRAQLAALVDAGAVAALVMEASTEDLPGSCDAVVTIGGTSASLLRPTTGVEPVGFAIDGVQADVAWLAARRLYPLDDPEEPSEGARLPARVSLSALMGVTDDPDGLVSSWQEPPDGLIATVGMTERGPLTIDLIADGPHGLVAGTTGSGKSEFLRSVIGSLAANYGPDRVTFALVDYKGGSAFDACADLPHVVGLITDLDRQMGRRALRSLDSELRYREEALRSAGVDDIDGYSKSGNTLPLPRLLVIIDEFAALSADLPDFVPSLVDIAQRGRSLGVHLILATQRPAGIVGEAIRANTNLRVALRVQTVADSRDVIDDPVAAQLPRRFPGRGFVRLGPGELVPFQTAASTAVPVVPRGEGVAVHRVRFGWEPVVGDESTDGTSQSALARLAEQSRRAVAALGLDAPRAPWAPPLPDAIELGAPSIGAGRVIGRVDEPDQQRVSDLVWDPAEGGLLAFGAQGSGSMDAIVAAACASALVADPGGLHIFGIDGGGGGLRALDAWPHVGSIVDMDDRERLDRLVRRLSDVLDERRRGTLPEAMVLLVVDRVDSVLAAFDGPADLPLRDALIRVIVDGGPFGVLPLLSAGRPGSVPGAVAASIGRRFCFRLTDPFDYAAVGLTPRDVPELGRGRGFDEAGRMIQVGRPSQTAIERMIESIAPEDAPAPIRVLPDRIPWEAVSHRSEVGDEGWFLPVGLGDRELLPVGFRLHAGDHVLIAGPARSGRTTALASIARLAAAGDPDVAIVALAAAGSPLEEAADLAVRSVDELVDMMNERTGATLALIDDAERIDHPELPNLLGRHRDGLHVIAAGRADALRGLYQHWTRDIRRCRLGVSLRPEPDLDGELWQTRFPRRGPSFRYPGRGYLVAGGDIEVVQVAAS